MKPSKRHAGKHPASLRPVALDLDYEHLGNFIKKLDLAEFDKFINDDAIWQKCLRDFARLRILRRKKKRKIRPKRAHESRKTAKKVCK